MRKYIAEGVGTMLLTLIACGVAVTSGSLVAIALAFGLVIVAAAYSIGNVSGCHINPAVSIALTVAGKMDKKECIRYIIAQIIGAFVGSLLLALVLNGFTSLGANGLGGNTTILIALVVEVILTFIFTTTILGVTDKSENGHATGIVIGLTLTLVHILGIAFTGTSVNPARSLGPALIVGGDALSCVWVFIVGPLMGGALAAIIYRFLDPAKKEKAEAKK